MVGTITEHGFNKEQIEFFGSKFLIGNGFLGYRGTLEEYTKHELVACTLSGLYDQNGTKWREPVNAPNPFFIVAQYNGEDMSVLKRKPAAHMQSIDMQGAVHSRQTTFDNGFCIASRRFVSMADKHVMAAEYTVFCEHGGDISLNIKIDSDIWDLNGPHLENVSLNHKGGVFVYCANTIELKEKIVVAQKAVSAHAEVFETGSGFVIQKAMSSGETLTVNIYAAVYKSSDEDIENCESAAIASVNASARLGFEKLLAANAARWQQIWDDVLVTIDGDKEAELALRYSTYLLLVSTPFHTSHVAIPARGLSGQVYKGAMFWDTEIYMLPFYCCCLPKTARNLVLYRINTLEGARRKAKEYGYRGAFYAWESQETGDEYCTEYNLNDIFTGRPIRTYFRDKQVHISADVVYGIWEYYKMTGDDEILLEGGAETIFECVRFLYSYSYFKCDKDRFEILDVTGADEYHERIHNDAFTNVMIKKALEAAARVIEILETKYPEKLANIIEKIDYEKDKKAIDDFKNKLYIPSPQKETGVIEQYDGYFKTEDTTPRELKKRIIKKDEYLGSPNGIAVNTQVIKQADVVLVTALFDKDYTLDQKLANFNYYEPRTEHGSSLSTCIYALAAVKCDLLDYAYKYFMRAAHTDLSGDYKLYAGDLYIGGTHPAANGGSWMVAILGFGGLRAYEREVSFEPKLPERWKSLAFRMYCQNQKFEVKIAHGSIILNSFACNTKEITFVIYGKKHKMQPGAAQTIKY